MTAPSCPMGRTPASREKPGSCGATGKDTGFYREPHGDFGVVLISGPMVGWRPMAFLRAPLVLVLVTLAFAGSVSAADGAKSKGAREKAAKKACSVGDFQKGVDILGDLFVETNDFNYVYNQGRCYQQNTKFEQAANRFREYLRKAKDLSDNDRAEVDRQVSECETSLARAAQVAPPPVTAAPPTVVRAETPAPAPEPATPEVATKPTPPPSDGSQGKGLRTAGIICAVVGLAAVGTGVGLALKTQSITSDEKKSGGATPSQENERKSLITWGWVSYGVGAAAVATGAILYIVGWPSDQSTNVALLPLLGPDGASVMLKGKF